MSKKAQFKKNKKRKASARGSANDSERPRRRLFLDVTSKRKNKSASQKEKEQGARKKRYETIDENTLTPGRSKSRPVVIETIKRIDSPG